MTVKVLIADDHHVLPQGRREAKSNSQIADCLHVSIKTVETHRQQVMNKLKRFSVAELTKYAIREGLTTL
jgi:DNA-binding NarL/FixJ family response regulator